MTSAIPIEYYLLLSLTLFIIGLVGVITRRNLIIVLMSLELVLNAVNINFVAFSFYLGDMTGRIFAIFSMAVAAAEVAIGLAIAVNLIKVKKSVDLDAVSTMKG